MDGHIGDIRAPNKAIPRPESRLYNSLVRFYTSSMSRNLIRALSSVSGSSSNVSSPTETPRASIATTVQSRTYANGSEDSSQKPGSSQRHDSGPLSIRCRWPSQLRYKDIAERVRASNPTQQSHDETQAMEVLTSSFDSAIGMKRWRAFRRKYRGGPNAARDAAEWNRLMAERDEYLKVESEKRAAAHTRLSEGVSEHKGGRSENSK